MHKEALKYLQIEEGGPAHRQALALWEEALALAQVATWRQALPAQEFWTRFHPHAAASQALGRLLRDSQEVVLLLATLGDRLEARARYYLARRESFSGYVLDRLGSYLVEREVRLMDRQINQRAESRGLSATRRYSPGYQDFSLEAQRVFVEMASLAVPGLRLEPSGLLRPEKTVTALKGLALRHPSPDRP